MPRASAAVSEQPVEEDFYGDAPEAPAEKGKKTRTERPVYVLFRVVDGDGNEIPGADIDVALVTKDSHVVAQTLSREKLSMKCLEVTK